uniref:HTH OST-type domain-containing protein n=1 Tax=Trichuris muris TaxID=70415 RepID=A0A5S6QQM5_TRIMR
MSLLLAKNDRKSASLGSVYLNVIFGILFVSVRIELVVITDVLLWCLSSSFCEMERDAFLKDLHSVLVTFKTGATAYEFARAYQDCLGRPLDLGRLGFKSVDDLMLSFPEAVEYYKSDRNTNIYKARTHAATKKLENLIANQKDNKTKCKFNTLRPVERRRPDIRDVYPVYSPMTSPATKVSRPAVKPPIPKPPVVNQPLKSNSEGAINGKMSTSRQIEEKTGRVAPGYLTCPGRYQWSDVPVMVSPPGSVPPQAKNHEISEVGKKENPQATQNASAAPFPSANSGNVNQNVPDSKCNFDLSNIAKAPPLCEAEPTKTQCNGAPFPERKATDRTAKAQGGNYENSNSSSATSRMNVAEEDCFNLCAPCSSLLIDGTGLPGASEEVPNGDLLSSIETVNELLMPFSNSHLKRKDEAEDGCVIGESLIENGVEIEIVKILEANLVTFVRSDELGIKTFKSIFNEMKTAYACQRCAPLQTPQVGDYVAVPCEDHWLRGVICALLEPESVLVFYIDMGVLHKVKSAHLYPLHSQLSEVPQIAFVGRLVGVPKHLWNGSIESLDAWFKQMTSARKVLAAMPDSSIKSCVGAQPADVHLYLRECGISVNLNALVKQKCLEMVSSTTVTFTLLDRIFSMLRNAGQ